MQDYQRDFIKFAIEQGVLKFGEFTLKSGRVSPYFFNAGLFNTGFAISKLGQFYAEAIVSSGLEFDVLFGPAYKGVPLAIATSIALAEDYEENYPWCFNRKEVKDHGEGGVLVGAPLKGDVLIIDDVMTAGTAIREVMHIVKAEKAVTAGVIIALDRQERGKSNLSAIQEIEEEFKMPVLSIISLDMILQYLSEDKTLQAYLPAVQKYREEYGV